MTWTGNPALTPSSGTFALAQAANEATWDRQNHRAATVVAGRAVNAADCAEILAMLGLVVPIERQSR